MASGRRSLNNPNAATQGTAFHELVVAPTFTPELSRPYHVPGSDLAINAREYPPRICHSLIDKIHSSSLGRSSSLV